MEKRRSWISVVLSLIFLVSLLFILGNLDIQDVQAADYTASVEFNMDAASQPAQTKTFTDANEKIGNFGLYDTGFWIFKQYFIGWSDQRDYTTNPNAKLYYENQSISEAFPEGTTEPQKLYAIFVGLSNFANVNGLVEINPDKTAAETVTGNIKAQSGFDQPDAEKKVDLWYDPGTESYNVDLSAGFHFNKTLANLVYRNPGGILVNSGTWSDGPKKGASYSHVDLHVQLDERLTMPDTLTDLSFTSYQYKPSYILDENYNILENISSSLVPGSPTSTFSFDRKGNTRFILRVTIRPDGNPVNALTATPEQVAAPMVLSTTNPNNFKITEAVAQTLSETGDNLVFKGFIDGNAKASSMVYPIPVIEGKPLNIAFAPRTYNAKHHFISGTPNAALPQSVTDLLPADQTDIPTGTLATPTDPAQKAVELDEGTWHFKGWDPETAVIHEQDTNFTGSWEFIAKEYTITHHFVSGTEGDALPQNVLELLPADQTGKTKGSIVTPTPLTQNQVIVADGTWNFMGWEPASATVENENIPFTGTWIFTKTPLPMEYYVHYTFVSGTEGKSLPPSVLNLNPRDEVPKITGSVVNPMIPETIVVPEDDGEWYFMGWDSLEATIVDSDVTFTGTWEFSERPSQKYIVTHGFASATPSKNLPQELIDMIPGPQTNLDKGTVVTPSPLRTTQLKVADGTWSFLGWTPKEATITDLDILFVGDWAFTEGSTPPPQTTVSVDPAPPIAGEAPPALSPQTGIDSGISPTLCLSLGLLGLAALAAFVLLKKH